MIRLALDPFQLVLLLLAGWPNQQQDIVDYLEEENRAPREQLGDRRLRFSDDQRRRLAVKAKQLGRRVLYERRSWLHRALQGLLPLARPSVVDR